MQKKKKKSSPPFFISLQRLSKSAVLFHSENLRFHFAQKYKFPFFFFFFFLARLTCFRLVVEKKKEFSNFGWFILDKSSNGYILKKKKLKLIHLTKNLSSCVMVNTDAKKYK